MSVIAQIRKILDHAAYGREATLAAFLSPLETPTTHRFWWLADAAGDETFENALKGTDLTAACTELELGTKFDWGSRKAVFTGLDAYAAALGYSLANGNLIDQYLAAVAGGGFRLPYYAALSYQEATSRTVPATRIGAKGILVADGADPSAAGMHKFGRYASGAIAAADGDRKSVV